MMRHIKMVRQLRAALDRLPSESREALYLRYYESLPIEEIADRMGLATPSDVYRLISESLRRVEALYSEASDEQ